MGGSCISSKRTQCNICSFTFIKTQTISPQRGASFIPQLMPNWNSDHSVPLARRVWQVYSASPGYPPADEICLVPTGHWHHRCQAYIYPWKQKCSVFLSSVLQGDQKKYLRQWWGCSGKHQESLEARCCGFKTLKLQCTSLREMFPKQSEKLNLKALSFSFPFFFFF